VFNGFIIIIKALFWDVQLLRDQSRRQASREGKRLTGFLASFLAASPVQES
jgi:hypothetical protein